MSVQSISGNYIDVPMIESPDKIYFANHYFQIIQLTANRRHKLFTVARTDTDVLTSRMSPFTAEYIQLFNKPSSVSLYVQQTSHKKHTLRCHHTVSEGKKQIM